VSGVGGARALPPLRTVLGRVDPLVEPHVCASCSSRTGYVVFCQEQSLSLSISRSTVGSAGTHQPTAAARRSQPDAGRPGCTCGHASAPPTETASRPCAYAGGRRAVVKDVGVRPPNYGKAAADDARPRPGQGAIPPEIGSQPPPIFVSCMYRSLLTCACTYPGVFSHAHYKT
jgi:hypothetical protein